ncbi:MAG: translation initiation factor IF-2 [Candidatus Omnitrophota bacterium]
MKPKKKDPKPKKQSSDIKAKAAHSLKAPKIKAVAKKSKAVARPAIQLKTAKKIPVPKIRAVKFTKPKIKKGMTEPALKKPEKPPVIQTPEPSVLPLGLKEAAVSFSAVEAIVKEKPGKTLPEEKIAVPPREPDKVIPDDKCLEMDFPVSVKDLSVKLQIKPSRLIQELLRMNIFATINQSLSEKDAREVSLVFGFNVKSAPDKEEQMLEVYRQEDAPETLKLRSPVVTFMGHVDHGKTSLLDIIRKTNITDGEHGGITQHIGAYEVVVPKGKITFLDTPGHEAFTAMRSHGAHITDIVVLVVAADDGIMPQTVEAIDHARAAGVPIIVAINKIDRVQADVDRVKRQLNELDLTPEDWQGKTITVGVSAKTGEGVDGLLEMIILESEMLELKANYQKPASGVVIEARHDKNRGVLATLLVEDGSLRINDIFICGLVFAKAKSMFNHLGKRIEEALPGTPIEVLGLTGLPEVGKEFFVVADEKQAREIIALREAKERKRRIQPVKRISLEELHSEIKQGKIKELKIIIKADVGGSLEAVRDSIGKLENPEVKFQIIHAGVGLINASDAILAKVANALILGFHVQPDERAKEIIEREGIEVRTYSIIYELIGELKAALEGMLDPKIKKVFLGRVEIRKVFKLSRSGTIAGCFVVKGKILRSATVSVVRNGEVVFEGKISSLKRFKDDVREAAEGFECGISLAGFDSYQEGDVIEAYEIQKIARTL